MAGLVVAQDDAASALTAATGKLSALWNTGGGFSVGRAAGLGHACFGQRRGTVGAGTQLARGSAAVWAELEDDCGDCAPGGAVRAAEATTGACDWHR